jgi:hypothetical protein
MAATDPLERPIFIGGTGSDGAAALASLLSIHPGLQATSPVRFGVITDPGGVVDAMRVGEDMRRASRTSWLDRVFAERQPPFQPEPMMGEERTPPEELVELLHRRFLPDPLLRPLGHRSSELTAAQIEEASERYLATFWHNPRQASVTLVQDLLRPTHGPREDRAAMRWIDASRLGAVRAQYLVQLFPEARFLHVVRDGREVALRQLEISTGSAFPGAPVSTVPIDPDKEWNQAAFERGLALWERRIVSAASGLQRVPKDRVLTVRLADLLGQDGAGWVNRIVAHVGAEPDLAVAQELRSVISPELLREGRALEVIPEELQEQNAVAYGAALARLEDLDLPTP